MPLCADTVLLTLWLAFVTDTFMLATAEELMLLEVLAPTVGGLVLPGVEVLVLALVLAFVLPAAAL